MKVLMLVQADHGSTAFESLYEEMGKYYEEFDIRWLTGDEQANLKKYFSQHVVIDKYNRIVCFIRFKKEIKQVRFLKKIPNLVFLEYDACQNYMPDSKYQGVFSKHYKKIPWAKVINSGYTVTQKLKSEGVDAVFVPKGYDNSVITDLGHDRDVELGFVGNLKNKTYRQRRVFLEDLAQSHGLKIEKTAPGSPYNKMLNRIKYFISADIGIGEYMQKNFEAMAAGCIVCAYDQGDDENAAFGFVDMSNIILYKNKNELINKIKLVSGDRCMQKEIINNGMMHANKYIFVHISRALCEQISAPVRTSDVSRGLFSKLLWK